MHACDLTLERTHPEGWFNHCLNVICNKNDQYQHHQTKHNQDHPDDTKHPGPAAEAPLENVDTVVVLTGGRVLEEGNLTYTYLSSSELFPSTSDCTKSR